MAESLQGNNGECTVRDGKPFDGNEELSSIPPEQLDDAKAAAEALQGTPAGNRYQVRIEAAESTEP